MLKPESVCCWILWLFNLYPLCASLPCYSSTKHKTISCQLYLFITRSLNSGIFLRIKEENASDVFPRTRTERWMNKQRLKNTEIGWSWKLRLVGLRQFSFQLKKKIVSIYERRTHENSLTGWLTARLTLIRLSPSYRNK